MSNYLSLDGIIVRCLLYSMRLWGHNLEVLHIASGTIFNEVRNRLILDVCSFLSLISHWICFQHSASSPSLIIPRITFDFRRLLKPHFRNTKAVQVNHNYHLGGIRHNYCCTHNTTLHCFFFPLCLSSCIKDLFSAHCIYMLYQNSTFSFYV